MMDIDYRKVVYVLIERGFCTAEDVRKIVGELAVVDTLDEGRSSEFWEDAKRLCGLLNEKVIANGFKPFAVNKTSVGVMEKIMRLDKRSVADVEAMILWSTQDDFWTGNIRSPEKLRKHFDLMTHQMANRGTSVRNVEPPRPQPKPVDADWVASIERAVDESVPAPRNLLDAFKRRPSND
jgi:hypothetical protein